MKRPRAQNATQLGQLQEQRARLAAIVDSSLDAITSLSFDGTITSWNEAAARLFGYTEREAIGSPASLILPSDRMAELEQIKQRLKRGERVLPVESVRVTKDGRSLPVYVAVSPVKDSAGQISGFSQIYRDLTEPKRAESRFQAAVESSPNGMAMVDREGRILLVNKEIERMFGYTRAELLDEPIEMLIPERYRERHSDFRLAFGASPETRPMGAGRELFGLRKDGSEVPVEIGLTPVDTEEGPMVIAAVVDISARKRLEAMREEAQRKDQFLAVLSHELRGPLASLRICVNLLSGEGRGGKRYEEAVDIADRQLEHLALLVDQLIDTSRIGTGKIVLDRRVRDLVEIVRTSAGDQRHVLDAGGVQLTLRLPDQPLWVNGDPLRLSQVVVNLLVNAAKFTQPGGHVTVTVAREGERELALLRIEDDGIGVDPEMLPLMFKPFTQLDHGENRDVAGLGLGLPLAQALVQAHGGSVEARSEGRGRGMELTVRLPLVAAPPTVGRDAASDRSARRPVPSRRILLVEDDRDTARSLSWVLEANGHQVEVATNGRSALAGTSHFRPDVVVCDIGLPGDMDGYAVAAAIRGDSAHAAPYLIALTGYAMPEDQARARAAGFDWHVTKGGDPRALVSLIAELPPRPSDG